MLMALDVALGVAAIAGDEETGALEYLVSKPVSRITVVLASYLLRKKSARLRPSQRG
jgi:hypothetical protein